MQCEFQFFHLSLINYALERGYSNQRWHSVLNTMLFKEENNIRMPDWDALIEIQSSMAQVSNIRLEYVNEH